ncbi:hypothetical protein C2845_PM06G06720 [Panicum miliaceum]|uniref:Uncharacterized protein n=1 Tax=Panicum miliaceum TaxID=4540 RepID=A0A3L6RA73_PANMI|nr:hypothetical protein C2845_PM06G06720 [Panicum miliaceum]
MSVAGTPTAADVLWQEQDGTRQHGVPSASLAPLYTHVCEIVPGQLVVNLAAVASSAGDSRAHGSRTAAGRRARLGVVRSLYFTGQTVRVSWLKPAPRGEEPSKVDI